LKDRAQKSLSIRRNTIANYVGSICIAILNFIFIPLYIKYLGIESYGLIGFSVSLSMLLRLADLGLSSTLCREFARYSSLQEPAIKMRSLLKTLQIIYWGISFIVGGLIIIISPFIAGHWINAGSLGIARVQKAVVLMGLTAVLQGPTSLYSSGIFGLQKHVLGNSLNIALVAVRSGGAVLALILLSPSITTFFVYQLIVALIGGVAIGIILWDLLPKTHTPSYFSFSQLKTVWRFAAGMSINSVLWLVLTQLDKIILIKMLPLQMFGYYSLASAAALATSYLSTPLFTTFLPRYTQLYSLGDNESLRKTYRLSCRLNAFIIAPTIVLLAFFSQAALLIWTRNPVIARQTYMILSLLVIGYGLNQIASLPYALQVASGWIKLSVYTNMVAVIVIVPTLVIATHLFGAMGACAVWIALNCTYVFIDVNVLHRRILKGEARHWYADLLLPLGLALGVGLLGRLLLPTASGVIFVFLVGLLWMLIIFVGILATPSIRRMIPVLSRL